jgi:hypothetical protein
MLLEANRSFEHGHELLALSLTVFFTAKRLRMEIWTYIFTTIKLKNDG